MATIEIIQACVSPVVMVSANGLLCLAFYNRMAAVVNRGRAINKERVDLIGHLAERDDGQQISPLAIQIKRRMQVLDCVGTQLLERARWVRRVLYCLLLSVLFMLACSLASGFAAISGYIVAAAVVFFVCGTLMMMAGIAAAIWELRMALAPLMFETECIDLTPLDDFSPLQEVGS